MYVFSTIIRLSSPPKPKVDMEMYKNYDVPFLNSAYSFAFFSTALVHMSMFSSRLLPICRYPMCFSIYRTHTAIGVCPTSTTVFPSSSNSIWSSCWDLKSSTRYIMYSKFEDLAMRRRRRLRGWLSCHCSSWSSLGLVLCIQGHGIGGRMSLQALAGPKASSRASRELDSVTWSEGIEGSSTQLATRYVFAVTTEPRDSRMTTFAYYLLRAASTISGQGSSPLNPVHNTNPWR